MSDALPISVDAARELLSHGQYVADRSLATAVFLSLELGRPLLLEGQEGWDQERVRKQIASRERLRVELDRPIPVHLSYITAWVNKDGTVHFRNDVYDRDKLLAKALLGNSS